MPFRNTHTYYSVLPVPVSHTIVPYQRVPTEWVAAATVLLGQRGALQPGTLEARHHHGALGVRGAVLAPPLVARHRGRARRDEGTMKLGGVNRRVEKQKGSQLAGVDREKPPASRG